ncbi:hypothetical protein niasHS_001632 [Heterodera schachtii]|uniref:EGF-like domain-containing protein n=1 Tax=Heterodera schachtii TaxID=97005 RepID=A0ABD2KED0_HETSC
MDLLLILCCLGGSPFIDFESATRNPPPAPFDHQWDPTDWVATDLSGSLLNASLSSSLITSFPQLRLLIPADLPPQLSLEQCDLWNLTFASKADENVFRRSRGKLKCRCPPGFSGSVCQHPPPSSASFVPRLPSMAPPNASAASPAALPLFFTAGASAAMALESQQQQKAAHSVVGISRNENSFALYLLIFLLLAVAISSLFAMLRGCCFCDCFGGFRRRRSATCGTDRERGDDDDDGKPLDAATVSRCLAAVQAHQQQQEKHNKRWGQQNSYASAASSTAPANGTGGALWLDSRRPLIPSVSECVQQQRRGVPLPPPAPPRQCSPPPSYRSLNNSLERLSEHTKM